jgi:hypothetical protein
MVLSSAANYCYELLVLTTAAGKLWHKLLLLATTTNYLYSLLILVNYGAIFLLLTTAAVNFCF